jgi:hypothetical protein
VPDEQTGEVRSHRWRCHSWRHAGYCRRARAAQEAERIAEALQPVDTHRVAHVLVTMDRTKQPNASTAYKKLWRMWQSLRQAIHRHYRIDAYVAAVEQHKDGWPHMHIILVGELAVEASIHGEAWATKWLKDYAVRCGFGWFAAVSVARDKHAVAGYIAKLVADEEGYVEAHGALAGELAKTTQLPMQMPWRCRRCGYAANADFANFLEGYTAHVLILAPRSRESKNQAHANSLLEKWRSYQSKLLEV